MAPPVGDLLRAEGLLLDASVLIEYRDSDPGILALAAEHLGPAAVVGTVLAEVQRLGKGDIARLGIEVVEATPDQEARAKVIGGGTSLQDRLCFVVCSDYGRVCVTNDKGLRRLCARHEVRTKFGLHLMSDLVATGVLPRSRARRVARTIQAASPDYYEDDILQQFDDLLSH